MSPASTSFTVRIIVTPVSWSPLSNAHCMGDAPRYLGKREACTLSTPRGNRERNFSERICPNAAVTPRSGASAAISPSPSRETFSYCSTGMPSSAALTLRGDGRSAYPLPTGLSGPVTAATTLCSAARFESTSAEKSGVPINTIFKSFIRLAGPCISRCTTLRRGGLFRAGRRGR